MLRTAPRARSWGGKAGKRLPGQGCGPNHGPSRASPCTLFAGALGDLWGRGTQEIQLKALAVVLGHACLLAGGDGQPVSQFILDGKQKKEVWKEEEEERPVIRWFCRRHPLPSSKTYLNMSPGARMADETPTYCPLISTYDTQINKNAV
ncbi:hypothetical protein I79_009143 [Cricetulus griseus]|uniref:Uncharacterized protein n=1 Tax=Cricetulus griseus TaxID=10029 RepID=G3HEZ2_CRIGR|nr:hypothetical protein I79_009143 [Cricetulus griseus]